MVKIFSDTFTLVAENGAVTVLSRVYMPRPIMQSHTASALS